MIDYCLVPYESLVSFDNFNVLKLSELLNNTGCYKEIDSTTCGSDHSLLTWTLRLNAKLHKKSFSKSSGKATERKFVKRIVPEHFLSSRFNDIEELISKLNDNVESQNDIDNVYEKLETVLTNEIESVLKPRTIKVSWGADNKKRRIKSRGGMISYRNNGIKPVMLKRFSSAVPRRIKRKNRITFLNLRKQFDKDVQKAKRQFRRLQQIEIDNFEEKNPREFWRENRENRRRKWTVQTYSVRSQNKWRYYY